MQSDLDIRSIESNLELLNSRPVAEVFDDVFLLGNWCYLTKDDRMLASVYYKTLMARLDS